MAKKPVLKEGQFGIKIHYFPKTVTKMRAVWQSVVCKSLSDAQGYVDDFMSFDLTDDCAKIEIIDSNGKVVDGVWCN